ncbi:MAG: hypothetical protein AAF609_15820 [Cyanobacteria bacterium P01_C01_bin.120]
MARLLVSTNNTLRQMARCLVLMALLTALASQLTALTQRKCCLYFRLRAVDTTSDAILGGSWRLVTAVKLYVFTEYRRIY